MTCYFYFAREPALLAAEKTRLSGRLAGRQIDHWVMDESNEQPSATRSHCFQQLLKTLGDGDTLIVERLRDFGCAPLEAIAMINALMSRKVEVVILEIDERNLATQENNAVVRMLNAIVDLDPSAFVSPASRSTESGCRARHKKDELERETIITQYSLGQSLTSLARQYKVSRSTIAKIVQPTNTYEPFYLRAFGD